MCQLLLCVACKRELDFTETPGGALSAQEIGSQMIGQTFLGRYEVIRLLGEGGMGRVYLARQLDLNRQVVVKVMSEKTAADPKFRARFERETRLMGKLQHPYVVTMYDATLDDPHGPCIVMEY